MIERRGDPADHRGAIGSIASSRVIRTPSEDARRPADALASIRSAMPLLDALGSLEEGESFVRLVWIEAIFAAGRRSEARDAAMDARIGVRSMSER